MKRNQRRNGFTIVELLIVIVVIAILATITTVTYSGVQEQARATKIKSDITQLMKASAAGSVTTNKTLGQISGASGTAASCIIKPSGTDLATLPKTDPCWVSYTTFLERVSGASNINVNNIVDPWGRPYYIDENEGENGIGCLNDVIAVYSQPFISGWSNLSSATAVPLTGLTGCQ